MKYLIHTYKLLQGFIIAKYPMISLISSKTQLKVQGLKIDFGFIFNWKKSIEIIANYRQYIYNKL